MALRVLVEDFNNPYRSGRLTMSRCLAWQEVGILQPWDVMLFDPRAAGHHPAPTDIYLIVEVMHSSTHRDPIDKRELYLQFQIPEYWIVDVAKREVRVHRQKTGFAASVHSGGSISPVGFPDVKIAIGDLFARI